MSAEPDPPPLSRRCAALDLILVILLVPASAVGSGILVGTISGGRPSLAAVVLVQGLLALAGAGLILGRRERGWREIGMQPPRPVDLARALLVLLVTFIVNAALMTSVTALYPDAFEAHLEGLESLALELTEETPLAAVLALLLVVGFYEEVLARGLLLTRSRQLLGGRWAPVLLSAALFAAGHFYQGPYGVVQTALIGLVLAAFTLRWGTLWPAILAHAAINMLSVAQLA